jgi:hypothetical protein
MKEFIEKLFGRLREEKHIVYEYEHSSQYEPKETEVVDYEDTIEIINQLAEEYNNGWIPCSERLPEKRDWYLAIFKEPDTGFIALPYIAEYLMGNHTAYTTNDGWIIKDCTDICDRESLYHKNLECVAWMPLPDPMKIME